jgi:hypothetical protein
MFLLTELIKKKIPPEGSYLEILLKVDFQT